MENIFKKDPKRGRKFNQKMKPYLVMKYLLEHTDKNNPITAEELASILQDNYDIYAERRSIYSDIQSINEAVIMLEQGCDITEASIILEEDKYQRCSKDVRKYKCSDNGFRIGTYEMARDEARHGKGLEGLLKRYF